MARRGTRRSRSATKRSGAVATGALAKLTVRGPSPHGGYGWVRDLPDDRDRFKARLRESFPDRSEAWIANAAGQLLRFRHALGLT